MRLAFSSYNSIEISHRTAATEDTLRRYRKIPQGKSFREGSEVSPNDPFDTYYIISADRL
jgi:hypothetical protein